MNSSNGYSGAPAGASYGARSSSFVNSEDYRYSSHGHHGSHGGHGHHHHRKSRRRKRMIKRIVIGVIVALVVLILVCGGLLAFSAYGVVKDAKAAMAEAGTVQSAFASEDEQAIQRSVSSIDQHVQSIKSAVDGPVWSIASFVPFIGTDISNVRTLGDVAGDLSANALVPLSQNADLLSLKTVFKDGQINVKAVQSLGDVAANAQPAVQRSADALNATKPGAIGQLNEALDKMKPAVNGINGLCSTISKLSPNLSDMLGANGKRTYLVLAHNTSELKASGGFIGSVGTVTFDNGKMDLGEFGSFWDCKGNKSTRQKLTTAEERQLFTKTYGINPGTSGNNPDFSREGEVSKALWEGKKGGTINGAFAVDSQVLADFLSLVGDVTLHDGTTVGSDNVVKFLGHDVYWKYFSKANINENSADASDAYFAEVAGLAFDKILTNISNVNLVDLASVLQKDTADHRLMVWMSDSNEEQAIDELGVSGKISKDEVNPQLGVFLESTRSSKLDWWQRANTEFYKATTNADGSVVYQVTSTFTNGITQDEVNQSSPYIHGKKNGNNSEHVYLYAPAGGSISDVQVSGAGAKVKVFTFDGHSVVRVSGFDMNPSESRRITYTVTTSPKAASDLSLRATPMAQEGSN